MATYRLVRRLRPIEASTPAPSAPPEPESRPLVATQQGVTTRIRGESHVWIYYGGASAQCSRCGADRRDSVGIGCSPRPGLIESMLPPAVPAFSTSTAAGLGITAQDPEPKALKTFLELLDEDV